MKELLQHPPAVSSLYVATASLSDDKTDMQVMEKRHTRYPCLFISVLATALLSTVGGLHSAGAQTEIRPGVRGGPALMTIADLPGESERQTGLSAGVFATVDVPGPLAIQPEVLYVQKNVMSSEAAFLPGGRGPVAISRDIETSYVEVPVLGKLQVPDVPVVTPTVAFGPVVGANVQSSQSVRATDRLGNERDLSSDQPPLDANGLEAGLLTGIGVKMDIGGTAISVSGRYRLGLTDVSSGGESRLDLGPSRGFSVTAGIAF